MKPLTRRCLIWILFLVYSSLFADDNVIGDGVLDALKVKERVFVVVAFHEPLSMLEARVDLPNLQNEVLALTTPVLSKVSRTDFRVTRQFTCVPALSGWVTVGGIAKLLEIPEVRKIDLDAGGAGHLNVSVPLIGANRFHNNGYTGDGVVVAILDSGLDTDHSDLGDDLIHEECFLDFDGSINGVGRCPNGSDRQTGAGAAEDDHGHGTNVTGIVTSRGTIAPPGVAPGAEIVAIKVLDSGNSFNSFTEIIAALDFIINNPQLGVQVINMSLGTFATFSVECDNTTSWNMAGAAAINTLRANGVIAFASSGNDGSGTSMSSPACLSNVVAVGATDDNDIVASFTNSNQFLDIMAPGVSSLSTGRFNSTSIFSGTSMASPHAAGSAALLIDAGLANLPDDIENMLKSSPVMVTDPTNGLSFPRIDLSQHVCDTLSLVGGWNLIGLPCEVGNPLVSDLIPGHVPNTLFSWNGTYVNENSMVTTKGYW